MLVSCLYLSTVTAQPPAPSPPSPPQPPLAPGTSTIQDLSTLRRKLAKATPEPLQLFLREGTTVSLDGTPLQIRSGANVTIRSTGAGASIDAELRSGVFQVNGSLRLEHMHLINGNETMFAPGIASSMNAEVMDGTKIKPAGFRTWVSNAEMAGAAGGGVRIWRGGTVQLVRSSVTACHATVGSAVYVMGGTLTASESSISECTVQFAGGVFVADGGSAIITSSAISTMRAEYMAAGLVVMDDVDDSAGGWWTTIVYPSRPTTYALLDNVVAHSTHSATHFGFMLVLGAICHVVHAEITHATCGTHVSLLHQAGDGSVVTFSKSVLANLTAGIWDGVYIEQGSKLIIDGCICTAWHAAAMGAGTLWSGACGYLRNSVMTDVRGPTFHGAWMMLASSFYVENCVVENVYTGSKTYNTSLADLVGWLAIWGGSIVRHTNCSFRNIVAGDAYGGFEIKTGSKLHLIGCTLIDCAANQGGGIGVLDSSSAVVARNTTLLNCQTTSGYGGAIALTGGGVADLFNVTIIGSGAATDGGALYLAEGVHMATSTPGAASIAYCSPLPPVRETKGLPFATGAHASLCACKIESCVAHNRGGAIAVIEGILLVSDGTRISGCNALNGGSVYQEGESTAFTFTDSTVHEGTATTGAGLCIRGGAVSMRRIQVIDCVATTLGGGLFVRGARATLHDSDFSGCSAGSGGGAIFVNVGGLQQVGGSISACTVTLAGVGGSAVYAAAGGQVALADLTVSGCHNPTDAYHSRGAIYVIGALQMNQVVVRDCVGGFVGCLDITGVGSALVVDSAFLGCSAPTDSRDGFRELRRSNLALPLFPMQAGAIVVQEGGELAVYNTSLFNSTSGAMATSLGVEAGAKVQGALLTVSPPCNHTFWPCDVSGACDFEQTPPHAISTWSEMTLVGLKYTKDACPSMTDESLLFYIANDVSKLSQGCSANTCGFSASCSFEASIVDGATSGPKSPICICSPPNFVAGSGVVQLAAGSSCSYSEIDPIPVSSTLAPYTTGCATPRQGTRVDVAAESASSVVVRLDRSFSGEKSSAQTLLLYIDGTGAASANWSVNTAQLPEWLTIAQPNGFIGAEEDTAEIGLTLATTGLPERSTPYTTTLTVAVASQVDTVFEVPVFLFVSAVVDRKTSIWGQALDNRSCALDQTVVVQAYVAAEPMLLTFTACDTAALEVAHSLPSASDPRVFSAQLRTVAGPSDVIDLSVLYDLATDRGRYMVSVPLRSRGTYALDMLLDGAPVGSTLHITAECASYHVSDGDAGCGCAEGTVEESKGTCVPCPYGFSSRVGALQCDLCALGFYHTVSARNEDECVLCSTLLGVTCGLGATVETLNLTEGYWRHSAETLQIHRCRQTGSWTPCRAGIHPGHEGDGYCESGYHGPWCESCFSSNSTGILTGRKYFDELDARCHDCFAGSVRNSAIGVPTAFLVVAIGGLCAMKDARCTRTMARFRRKAKRLWSRAGMRFKVKAFIGFYQCVASINTVYEVENPPGLEKFYDWIYILELPLQLDFALSIPAECFGSYRTRLNATSAGPIILIFVIIAGLVGLELLRRRRSTSFRAAVRIGFQKGLPLALVVTFILVTSTATRIFRSFLCVEIEFDSTEMRRYMHDDLSLSCSSSVYHKTRQVAVFWCIFWPVGVPALYFALLWTTRGALRARKPTRLCRATAFLWADYKAHAWWWEPIEMCRKLALVGWVLQIHEGRILVALLVSGVFLALQLSVQPLKRSEDGALMVLIQVSLIVMYLCVLLVNACYGSSEVCETFGFGSTASGIYLFFVFFCLGLLTLISLLGGAYLWMTGSVPKVLLLARAHSVTPRQIVFRVMLRGYKQFKRRVIRLLQLDTPHLTPAVAAAIYHYRTAQMQMRTSNDRIPELPIAMGNLALMSIDGIFPETNCFVRVDLQSFALRWAQQSGISLYAIEDVQAFKSVHRNRFGAAKVLQLVHVRASQAWFVVNDAWRKGTSRISRGSSSRKSKVVRNPLGREPPPARNVSEHAGSKSPSPRNVTTEPQSARHSISELQNPRHSLSEPQNPRHSLAISPSARRSSESWLGEQGSEGSSPRRQKPTRPNEPNVKRRVSSVLGMMSRIKELRGIDIHYSDSCGVSRVLQLRMNGDKVGQWSEGIAKLLSTVPSSASPAHWRWVLSCMAATSSRGASGCIRHSELRALLRRANASPDVSDAQLEDFLRLFEDAEEQLPKWLCAAFKIDDRLSQRQADVLHVRPIADLLLRLCTSSKEIAQLFDTYANGGRVALAEWIQFVRKEQLNAHPDATPGVAAGHTSSQQQEGVELAQAHERFARAVRGAPFPDQGPGFDDGQSDQGIDLLQFALLLLSPLNDAVVPAQDPGSRDDELQEPIFNYWIACSHNSYIIGDQLTGLSTDNAYRRQLLQGVRFLEIDCWDSKGGPIVTHGHTFCTSERFGQVSKAIADSAFVTCEAPLLLSMEMHCSPPQQNQIAQYLIDHLGDMLLTCDEVVHMERSATFSPLELKRRVLVKGRVKNQNRPKKRRTSIMSKVRRTSLSLGSGAIQSLSFGPGSRRTTRTPRGSGDSGRMTTNEEESSRPTDTADTLIDFDEASLARRTLAKAFTSSHVSTDELYTSVIALRSQQSSKFTQFTGEFFPDWKLPVSSMSEDVLLQNLGLSAVERAQLEGLSKSIGENDAWVSSSIFIQLAANPPTAVGDFQRRARTWLLRPFPHGLRFSGNNMSPLPGWLAGAQACALNMSNNDLPVQLHHALFKGSCGFLLKPPEMRTAEADGELTRNARENYWPPARKLLHRTSFEMLSLHNLPKRGERRPRYDGSRGECHKYHPEMSGSTAPPTKSEPSSPVLTVSLHPIGGFCAVSQTLPLALRNQTHIRTRRIQSNGLNPAFNETVHCVAAEPHTTFLRIAVEDAEREVAYQTAVLGRLRHGYRVFQLRGMLGTRIELCYLFVRISFASEENLWATSRELRLQVASKFSSALHQEVSKLKAENERLRRTLSRGVESAVECQPSSRRESTEEPAESTTEPMRVKLRL